MGDLGPQVTHKVLRTEDLGLLCCSTHPQELQTLSAW